MMQIHAKHILLGRVWKENARVITAQGRIVSIEPNVAVDAKDHCVGALLPALPNLHSHTFQRAMAGMTEYRDAGKESFWTWRDLMYRFLDHLTPEHYEAIAGLAFMEMLEAGFASVGEFHYVHHKPGGERYGRLSELSDQVFAAAAETGIGLTHLPVLYSYGGVNQEPLKGGQLRFSNDVDQFLELVGQCSDRMNDLPSDWQLGIAPHSLRATSPDDLARVLGDRPIGPVHIHISEQVQEVTDVEAKFGQRPVAWLLDNADVNARWCLIHATHMTQAETQALAKTGAVAGLCPITEANLGDGIFNGPTYLGNGGEFGVGTDSNIRISMAEELRMLEYSQRLRDRERNLMVTGSGSVGETLYVGAAQGGAQALGRDCGEIRVGDWADLVALNPDHPALCALSPNQFLDGLCFASGRDVITDCWSAGRHMVKHGRHIKRDTIVAQYRKAVSSLLSAI